MGFSRTKPGQTCQKWFRPLYADCSEFAIDSGVGGEGVAHELFGFLGFVASKSLGLRLQGLELDGCFDSKASAGGCKGRSRR